LRDHLGLRDSDLSKQMSALVAAGYVTVRKTGKGANRRTWFRATAVGVDAANAHIAAEQSLVDPTDW